MGICHSILSPVELKEYHNIDIDKLWEDFVKDCCEVAPGNYTPYFVMDSAFITYAVEKLKLYDTTIIPAYKKEDIVKSLSCHLAKLLTLNDIIPSRGWRMDNHFISTNLCTGITVKSIPRPTEKTLFRPYFRN